MPCRRKPGVSTSPADIGNADGVAVLADARHGALEVPVGSAEAQPVEERDRPGAHRHDVTENPADSGGCALERLDRGRMVVRLDLEGHRKTFPEVEHAGILARPLQNPFAAGRQPLEQRRGVLVPAMLGPEQREHRQLEVVRGTIQQLPNAIELVVGEAEATVQRFRD